MDGNIIFQQNVTSGLPQNLDSLILSLLNQSDCTSADGTEGVELWGECYSIENTIELDLHGNELIGPIPPEIGNLTNLTDLRLNDNQLTGPIPPEIGNLTNLNSLWLNDNQLNGVIPESICDLNIDFFAMPFTNNQLCPPYPSCIEAWVGEQDCYTFNIVLNEIMKNPGAVSDSDGEWFELYNAGDDTVDITGWTFKDSDNDSFSIDVNCCINIPPNEYFVLICNGDTATNGGISKYDLVYDREVFNLGNSDDEIIMIDTYEFEIDRVQYDNGTNFPDPNGLSMELIYHNLDNNDGANWIESTNMLPSGDYGTPGEGNSTFLPALTTQIDANCVGTVQGFPMWLWMDLGEIQINDTSECMLIVSNVGYGDLILSNIHIGEINDNPNTAFSVTVDSLEPEIPAESSLVIPPEGSDSIIVHFAPEEEGFYSGNLSFDTNDENMPTHNEPVHATGLSPVREIYIETDFDSDTIYFYDAQIGDDSYFESIYIFNLGNTTLEIDDIIATEPFHVGIITDGSLDPVETLEVPVQFYPDSAGDYSGTVTIYSNDSDEEEVIIHLYGDTETLSIDEIPIPDKFTLHQNHPNPFNPITTLRYDLPEDALVNITIYDMMGRRISTLVNNQQSSGYKSVRWNATNDKGSSVSAGLYLYTIQAGEFRQTKKMVLLK